MVTSRDRKKRAGRKVLARTALALGVRSADRVGQVPNGNFASLEPHIQLRLGFQMYRVPFAIAAFTLEEGAWQISVKNSGYSDIDPYSGT